MKPEEKKACFDNLAKEIKVMRRKFTRFNKSISKKKEQEATAQKDREFLETCFRAQQILKETTFEMPDQAHVIENLTKIINNGSLALDSLEFYQICSLVRKVMKKQKNKGKFTTKFRCQSAAHDERAPVLRDRDSRGYY